MPEKLGPNLNRVETERLSDSIIVEGGVRLFGEVEIEGGKNAALPAIALSVLGKRLKLNNYPNIADTASVLGILTKAGASVETQGKSISINTEDVSPREIDPRIAKLTTGSRYLIPVYVSRFGEVTTGPSGGDNIGGDDRFEFSPQVLERFREMGIGSELIDGREKRYRFFKAGDSQGYLDQKNRFFGPTMMSILFRSVGNEGEFRVYNPSVEPEIFATAGLVNKMGGDVSYHPEGREYGRDHILIKGRKELHEEEYKIMPDPNEIASYAAATLATNGLVVIKGVGRNSKIDKLTNLIYTMGGVYDFNLDEEELIIRPSLVNRLKPTDLKSDFWPDTMCHTDWQQLFTPILAMLSGSSFIDENVSPARFTSVEALNALGANLERVVLPDRISRPDFKTDGKPHTLFVPGGTKFHGGYVDVPGDIRGATSVLVAALAAGGKTVIQGASQIERGLASYKDKFRNLGAKIEEI